MPLSFLLGHSWAQLVSLFVICTPALPETIQLNSAQQQNIEDLSLLPLLLCEFFSPTAPPTHTPAIRLWVSWVPGHGKSKLTRIQSVRKWLATVSIRIDYQINKLVVLIVLGRCRQEDQFKQEPGFGEGGNEENLRHTEVPGDHPSNGRVWTYGPDMLLYYLVRVRRPCSDPVSLLSEP